MSKKDKDCCWNNLDKAVNASRATWKCIKCGKDVSLEYVLYRQSLIKEKEKENEKV